ncbi:hypothetical protein L218DRAFT_1046515 [Marasmius fiardii PR-910]|nr:hypothetical protein L218DRAFT_1046515 [Marasmius fiardii PR-910]
MISLRKFSLLTLCTLAVSVLALASIPANVTLYVRAGTFTNPLNQKGGADPCLRFINGRYFLTTTVFLSLDIAMWSATTIEGLKTATPKVLFSDKTPDRYCTYSSQEGMRLMCTLAEISIFGKNLVGFMQDPD